MLRVCCDLFLFFIESDVVRGVWLFSERNSEKGDFNLFVLRVVREIVKNNFFFLYVVCFLIIGLCVVNFMIIYVMFFWWVFLCGMGIWMGIF